jgi:predicted glycosyltransferase
LLIIPKTMRFLLYSHDSYGLGHLRRSVTIAGRLLEQCPGASVLIATGSPVATSFRLPRGVDILKLPSVTKDRGGSYISREWSMGLEDLLEFRARLLVSAIEGFKPHVLLVDHKPTGLLGELETALKTARSLGARCVLGLRDIVDHPDAMESEWGSADVRAAIENGYDQIMVYGDREIFDASVEYPQLAAVKDRLIFTGYVVRPRVRPPIRPLALLQPHVVVTVGGGEDGADRVSAYLDAAELDEPFWSTTIVLGPLFGSDSGKEVKRRAATVRGVTVHRSHDDLPSLFRDASTVVSMAGYNSCAEILQARIPSVLLPRVTPRREQLLRATRLSARGLVRNADGAKPDELLKEIHAALEDRRITRPLPSMLGAQKAAAVLLRGAIVTGGSALDVQPAHVTPTELAS